MKQIRQAHYRRIAVLVLMAVLSATGFGYESAKIKDGILRAAETDGVFMVLVAASDAPWYQKMSTPPKYWCDGVDDDVQINAAKDSYVAVVGKEIKVVVQLSIGTFYTGNPIKLYREGTGYGVNTIIRGSAMESTKVYLQAGANCNMVEGVIPATTGSTGLNDLGFIGVQEMVLDGQVASQSSAIAISNVTKESGQNVVITTTAAHPFTTGDIVKFASVGGSTELNFIDVTYPQNSYTRIKMYFVTKTGDTTFSLDRTSAMTLTGYTSGGTVSANGCGIWIDRISTTKGLFDANIFRVMAIRCAGDGFNLGGVWGYKINDCITEICSGSGVVIENSTAETTSSQNYIDKLFSAYNKIYGLYTRSSTSFFTNIYIYDVGDHGVLVWGGNNQFSNLYIGGFGSATYGSSISRMGIYIYNGDSNQFNNFIISGQSSSRTKYGIYPRGNSNLFSNGKITGIYQNPVITAIESGILSYGNQFLNIVANRGTNAGEGFAMSGNSQLNTFTNCNALQSAVAATTVIYPQGICVMTTAAGAINATLADGANNRDRLMLQLTARGSTNNAVITVANHTLGANSTITFDAAEEYAILEWDTTPATDCWTTVAATATIAGP